MKTKVLHVVHWPKSGIVSLLRNFLSNFPGSNVTNYVVFFESDEENEQAFKRIADNVDSLDVSSSWLAGVKKFRKIISDINPDIIHTHSFQPGFWAGIFGNKGAQVIRSIHSNYPYYYKNDIKSRFKRVMEYIIFRFFTDRIICISNAVRDVLPWTFSKGKVSLIKNGISFDFLQTLDQVSKKTIRAQLGLPNDAQVLVSLGRLEGEKGYDILIDSFALLSKQFPKLYLLLIGEGSQRSALETKIETHGLADKVILAGYQKEPIAYLNACDIYVCSSHYEGLGMSVIEAMAIGLPVVATRAGGVEELVEHNKTGYLVEGPNVAAIEHGIAAVLNDVNLQTELVENAHKFVLNSFDIRRVVKDHIELYAQCLGKGDL